MKFMEKFKPEKNMVKEFNKWVVLIREKQVTLGAVIIALKRDAQSLSDLTIEESAEFVDVVAWFEKTCISLYGANKFNYIAAMMKDNFVHYHAFPRYADTIKKYNIEWIDKNWPKVIEFIDVSYEDSVICQINKDMSNSK